MFQKKKKRKGKHFACLSLGELIAEQLLSEAGRQGEDGEREEPNTRPQTSFCFSFFSVILFPPLRPWIRVLLSSRFQTVVLSFGASSSSSCSVGAGGARFTCLPPFSQEATGLRLHIWLLGLQGSLSLFNAALTRISSEHTHVTAKFLDSPG